MTVLMRLIFLAVCTLFALLLTACVSTPIVPPQESGSLTGGVALNLWFAKLDTRQYEYFRVEADGTFSYGGGMKAFNRTTEWTGKITADEGKRLRALIDGAKWMTAEDPALHTAEGPLAEITVASSLSKRSFNIEGPNEYVLQIVELLSKAAQQRFDRYMQRLPEPGTQLR